MGEGNTTDVLHECTDLKVDWGRVAATLVSGFPWITSVVVITK